MLVVLTWLAKALKTPDIDFLLLGEKDRHLYLIYYLTGLHWAISFFFFFSLNVNSFNIWICKLLWKRIEFLCAVLVR